MPYRPLAFKDFVGQEDIIKRLKISIEASNKQNDAIPHLLFCGGPGLGKTTMAHIIGAEMGVRVTTVMAADLKSSDSLFDLYQQALDLTGYDVYTGSIVGKIKPNIIFADEIHKLAKKVQEALYPALEDFVVYKKQSEKDPFGYGYTSKMTKRILPRFTLIGATTEAGKLERPFRDRFGHILVFRPYAHEEMVSILQTHATENGWRIESGAALLIAERARGVARIAINLMERCVDVSITNGKGGLVDADVTNETFHLLDIDAVGLNELDIKYLKYLDMIKRPVGISTISEFIGESQDYVSDVIEPFLVKMGFIVRSPSGRLLTPIGKRHLITGGAICAKEVAMIGAQTGEAQSVQ